MPFFTCPSTYASTYPVTGVARPHSVGDHPSHIQGAPAGFLQAYATPDALAPGRSGLEARKLIDDQLSQTGVLLLQCLPITTHQQCIEFVHGMGYNRAAYEPVGKRREKITGELDAATTIPGDYCITLHNEMAYNPKPTNKILLMCLQPAEQGGANLLAKSSDVLHNLPPGMLDTFEKKGGVRYVRRYSSANNQAHDSLALTWQERTGTADAAAAMQFWREVGFTDVSMLDDGTLEVSNTEPACKQAPDGSYPFVNSASQPLFTPPQMDRDGFWTMSFGPGTVQMQITYGNGEPIELDTCSAIEKAKWDVRCAVPLPAGSMLVLDNWAVMHGRLAYTGSRSMIVLLTDD